MHALHIALQEGFAHDAVVVSIDGEPVYRAENISTRRPPGLAAFFYVTIVKGSHAVEVRTRKRGLPRYLQTLDIDAETWLGVSMRRDGQLDVHVATKPFNYM